MEKVLITGGVGFVGAAIVRAIRQKDPQCKISVLDLQLPARDAVVVDVDYYQADVTRMDEVVEEVCRVKPRVIIHTAGLVPPLSQRYGRAAESEVFHVNVIGTRNVLEAARRAGVQALVFTSSVTVLFDDLTQDFRNVDESVMPARQSLIYGESKVNGVPSV